MNVDRLPFDDGFFDLVTATEVLEHLYDTDHALDEIRRVLSLMVFSWSAYQILQLGIAELACSWDISHINVK